MEQFQWGRAFATSLEYFLESIAAYAPNIFAALLALLIGWLLARLIRALSQKLTRFGLRVLSRTRVINQAIERSNLQEQAPRIIGIIMYWVVLLFFVAVAVERLELSVATTIVSSVTVYLPKVLIGAIIIFIFFIASNIAFSAVNRSAGSLGVGYARLLGRIAQFLVLTLGIVVGAEEMGIESDFLTAIVTIVFAATLGGASLAFGLGSGLAISNIVSSHYLNRIYKVGQIVRIGDTQGRIVAINQTGFVLDTDDGQLLVPGRKFSKETSMLVKEDQS